MNFAVVFSLVVVSTAAFSLPKGPQFGGRVWNGQEAEPHSAPYMISLALNFNETFHEFHFCGGVILNTHWVLTAAHCIFMPEQTVLIAGQHDVTVTESWEQRRFIARHYGHEDYCGGVCPFDIGLLYVDEPFVYTNYVQPIQLPARRTIPSGVGRLYGWGNMSNGTELLFPDKLQYTDKPIIPWETCVQIWDEFEVHPSNLCTGPLDGSTSACNTDSGGPLIQWEDGVPTVIGIISWGSSPCGTPNTAGVYVRVSVFIDWIYRTTGVISN